MVKKIQLDKKEVARKISKRETLARMRRGLSYTPTQILY